MRWPILISLALSLACAGSPLRIVSVDRQGEPPYENENRVYRVLGDGWDELKVGSRLELRRPGDNRNLGRLEVVSVGSGFVLARMAAHGATYPLVGDLVITRESRPQSLPHWPGLEPNPLPALANLVPQQTHADLQLLEPLFFLRGDSSLSPGGERKLEEWVQAYGKDGRWFLLYPADPRQRDELVQARCQALKTKLERLGVGKLEVRKGPFDSHEKYDFVRVGREP